MRVGRDDDVVPALRDRGRSLAHATPSLVSHPHTTAGASGRRRAGAPVCFAVRMHTSSTLILVLAVFAASLVEMVEALTIVVAAGVSRGWRPALEGAAAAVVVLGVLVLAVGVPLIRYIPIDALRVVV